MKKVLFALVAVATVVISSCGGSKSDPKAVAKSWLEARNSLKWEEAKKLSTEDTKKFLDMQASFSSMIPDSVKKQTANMKVEIKGDAAITGDKAVVTYTSAEKEGDQTLNLEKGADGKWLVKQSKDVPAGSEAPATTDEAMPVAADSTKK
jgi:hypothetical protein